jgi:energy-coupling factor transporter ATP-binding protein EcfA2
VTADLPLAPAIVLLGPNDSGKTNLLRCVTALLSSTSLKPRDPFPLRVTPDEYFFRPGGEWNALWLDIDLNHESDRAFLFETVTAFHEHEDSMRHVVFHLPDRFSESEETFGWEDPLTPDGFLEDLFALLKSRAELANDDPTAVPNAPMSSARLEIAAEFAALHFQWPNAETADLDLPEWVWFFTAKDALSTEVVSIDEVSVEDALEQFRVHLESMRERDADSDDDFFDEAPDMETAYPRAYSGRDEWFDHEGKIDARIVRACEAISRAATELAPSFLSDRYTLELQPLDPAWWKTNRGHRLRVALLPQEHDRAALDLERPSGFDVEAVGAGLQPWALFSLHEAFRRAREETTSKAPLFVFDEPERHLHPTAQRQAAEFIAGIVKEGGNVFVATHSPAFISAPIPHVEYVRVARVDGVTQANALSPALLDQLEKHALDLGLLPVDLLQLTRRALLVEGKHDRQVLSGFFRSELSDAFVRILLLFGSDNALSLIDAQLLHEIGVQSYVMLDNTRQQQVAALNSGRLRREDLAGGKEARKLVALAQAIRSTDLPIKLLALPLPDIVWALPEEAMRRVVPAFSNWDELTAKFRQQPPMNPKNFLAQSIGVTINSRLIDDVIAVSSEMRLRPHPSLIAAVAELLDIEVG